MATTTPNFGWPVPTSTDLVKDGAVAIESLGDAIDASLLDLKGGTTGQVLSKTSNTDMDFTWVAQDDSNAIQNALLTTTGDTIYASGASTPARRAIGTTGQVLTVSGGVPVWATPAVGGGDFVLIKAATTFTNVANTGTTFDSLFTTTYNAYLVVVEYIHAVTGTHDLYWQFRRGTTTQTTGYYYNSIGAVYTGAGVTNTGAANDTKFQLTTTMSDSAATGLTGTINITSTGGTARYPGVNGILTEDGTASMYVFAGNQSNNYDYTGFILSSSSSNISGKISVYGVKA